MAKITASPKIEVSATMTFNEQELRALEALVCYGTESFLKFFYKDMGTTYMKPHEAGLVEFFDSVRNEVPKILSKTRAAKEAFQNG